MDEFFIRLKTKGVKTTFDEVLNGFDIMVGGFFYFFYLKGIIVGVIAIDEPQLLGKTRIFYKKFVDGKLRQLTKRNEVFNFNADSITDKCPLGEIKGKVGNF